MKISKLTLVNDVYFDFRFHFLMMLTEKKKNDVKVHEFHVVLDEANVAETFFDDRIKSDIFGNRFYSAVFRFAESTLQDNECPVESVISQFDNQSFRGQCENSGEDRAFIKVNGDPSASRTKEMCMDLALLSVAGVSAWNITPMTLPITFGRYKNTLPKAFKTVKNTSSKHNYMYGCSNEEFKSKQKSVTDQFRKLD